jgi:hypothetical protein
LLEKGHYDIYSSGNSLTGIDYHLEPVNSIS